MPGRIESIAIVPASSRSTASSIELSTRAAADCLAKAGRSPDEVDLLINAGVHRDENICEPALAAFVQLGIGAKPTPDPEATRGTLSFDVSNGSCGVVSALQIVDGFVRSGRIRSGLVVASDVDATPGVSRGFEFEPVGAAVLVGDGGDREGFSAFHQETFSRHQGLFGSRLDWTGERHELVVVQDEKYLGACLDCTEQAVQNFLGKRGLSMDDIDLIAPASAPAGFPRAFGGRIGTERIASGSNGRHAHSAAPLVALEAALASHRFETAERLLIVAVGAGITVSLALYEKETRSIRA